MYLFAFGILITVLQVSTDDAICQFESMHVEKLRENLDGSYSTSTLYMTDEMDYKLVANAEKVEFTFDRLFIERMIEKDMIIHTYEENSTVRVTFFNIDSAQELFDLFQPSFDSDSDSDENRKSRKKRVKRRSITPRYQFDTLSRRDKQKLVPVINSNSVIYYSDLNPSVPAKDQQEKNYVFTIKSIDENGRNEKPYLHFDSHNVGISAKSYEGRVLLTIASTKPDAVVHYILKFSESWMAINFIKRFGYSVNDELSHLASICEEIVNNEDEG